MMKKLRIIVVLSILVLLTAVVFIVVNNVEVEDGEMSEPMISIDMVTYTLNFRFRFRIVIDGEATIHNSSILATRKTNPNSQFFDPFYTDFILVHNQEQASGFPDNVITAWPPNPELLIDTLNQITGHRSTIDDSGIPNQRFAAFFENHDITYPLTTDDLVYNWENVYRLLRAFNAAERNIIQGVVIDAITD